MLDIFEWLLTSQTVTTALLVGVAIILLFWRALFEKHRYPPGPIPWPIIGNNYVQFMSDRAGYRFKNWRKYGNVVSSVSLGEWSVMLLGYDAIHEAFVKNADHFSDRSVFPTFMKFLRPGMIFGKRWKDLRRQALMVLREHGMGKVAIEEKIREELEYNFELFATIEGPQASSTFQDTIGKAVSNIITQVVFGHRLEYTDSNFSSFQHFDVFFLTLVKAQTLPFYKYWPWDPLHFNEQWENLERVKSYIIDQIRQHKAELDVDYPKDYIDSFLVEGIKTGDSLFADEDELVATIIQLYIGGFDTTSTTLTWALLFLINYPQVQSRLHEEITHVIGNRPVTIADRESMSFTQSFIHEVLRCGSIAGSSLAHTCTKDTVIQGHNIPQGTTILANLKSTCLDETVFEDPDLFKADRFLDDGGSFVKPSDKQMLPFSIGRRVCPGELLARAELFIILVSFVQRFEVRRITEEKEREDGIDVFGHNPRPFQFSLMKRT